MKQGQIGVNVVSRAVKENKGTLMGMSDIVITNRVPFMKKVLICFKVEIIPRYIMYEIVQVVVFLVIFTEIPISVKMDL